MGDDQGPQQLFTCEACDGSGIEVFGVWVYEHGCGVPHKDTDERPCKVCGGAGEWIGDAESDDAAYNSEMERLHGPDLIRER